VSGFGPGEAVEGVRQELGRKTGALVGHRQDQTSALDRRPQGDRTAAVPQSVVEQGTDGRLQPVRIDMQPLQPRP
jgi:hypothetical protein